MNGVGRVGGAAAGSPSGRIFRGTSWEGRSWQLAQRRTGNKILLRQGCGAWLWVTAAQVGLREQPTASSVGLTAAGLPLSTLCFHVQIQWSEFEVVIVLGWRWASRDTAPTTNSILPVAPGLMLPPQRRSSSYIDCAYSALGHWLDL